MLRVHGAPGLGRRAHRLVLLAALVALFSSALMFAQAPTAHAEPVAQPFCNGAWLLGQNQAESKCFSPGQYLTEVEARAYQASVCVNGWINGGAASNWNCGIKGTYVGIRFNGSRFMNGVIRNNVDGWNQVESGWYWHNG